MKKKGFMIPDELLLATDINNTEKVLLGYLINREYNSGDYGEDLTQQQMADRMHTSLVTINKAIMHLEKEGYIESIRVQYSNNRFRNVYRVSWKRIEENEEK